MRSALWKGGYKEDAVGGEGQQRFPNFMECVWLRDSSLICELDKKG